MGVSSLKPETLAKRRKYKREWMARWRANNPEKYIAQSRRSEMRKVAREQAEKEGISVHEAYVRCGVV